MAGPDDLVEHTAILIDSASKPWAKNVLIFMPLFLGHVADNFYAVLKTVVAFLDFGVIASATYIINDLADLEADRVHVTKRSKPQAESSL
ncbi:Decaprenyl-phosphate phosphoribosyltransferase [Ensifer psoraleae]|uniref:hypothetical protein n=1 Tax=Sinorhizobium psoraleae TaxID=520838 RepID=UPI0015684F54|nr:hypothetical protein [Sinorhizobium psoraleae]NRP75518.1 Decaprenyl-phosphate phosphoribosyltransferase [Sinorhizobium psoraleae]